MHIEPGHPDAAHPLLVLAARVLEDMGGEVVLHTRDDNLVRSRRDGDPGSAPFIVEAAGLPNLLHELVHVLQFGRLADDHGLDYGQIPLDLGDPAHRRHLWEELACCLVSCAYLEPAAEAAWFAEQVGIQGVFYSRPTARSWRSSSPPPSPPPRVASRPSAPARSPARGTSTSPPCGPNSAPGPSAAPVLPARETAARLAGSHAGCPLCAVVHTPPS